MIESLKRLSRKYGLKENEKPSDVLKTILQRNSEKVVGKHGKITEQNWRDMLSKASKMADVLPKETMEFIHDKALFTMKSETNARDIIKNLKTKVSDSMRKTVRSQMEIPEVAVTGQSLKKGMNKKLVMGMEDSLRDSFQPYTKRQKGQDLPTQINNIVVTEVRSALNEFREEYVADLLKQNPGLDPTKTWKQHPELSDEPRRGHREVNGVKIHFDDLFHVPLYVKKGGKDVRQGITLMRRPHAADAPASQIVNCHCEILYDLGMAP